MAKYYFSSRGEHIATGYTEKEMEGAGYFLLILIALPFALFAAFFESVGTFIGEHGVLFSIIYFAVIVALAIWIYCSVDSKNKVVGIVAVVMNSVPLYLFNYEVFSIGVFSSGLLELIGQSLNWLLVSAVILVVSGFIALIGIGTENGIWHILISVPHLALGIYLFT